MTSNSIIKWRLMWAVWIPLLLFLVPLILEGEMVGTIFTPYLYGILLLLYGVVYYFRLRLWQVPVLAITTCLAVVVYFLSERPDRTVETLNIAGIPAGDNFLNFLELYFTTPVWFAFLVVSFISFVTMGKVFIRALDLENSAIKLFKISARNITDANNGYTARPYNIGNHSFGEDQLFSFATFLDSKRICLAEFSEEGVKLIFSMGISPLSKKYKDKISYVSFNRNGNFTVFISEHDYRQYKKQYTFDQLCEMMGKTFLRFADYHARYNEKRIITELKSA